MTVSRDAAATERNERAEMLRLQRFLLPPSLPAVHCTEAAAAYRPHNHVFAVGGDWYDLIDLHDRSEVVAVVGDVVGHGLEQISVMGQLRAASNALARVCAGPVEILQALDGFASELPGAAMATMAVVTMNGTRVARLASAGHLPLLHLKGDGSFALVEGGRRPPLTIDGPAERFSFEIDINDLLILFTDGVVERRGEPIDHSMSRLAAFARERFGEPCRDIATAIVDEFAADAPDDAATMVLRPLHQRDDGYELIHPHPVAISNERARVEYRTQVDQ